LGSIFRPGLKRVMDLVLAPANGCSLDRAQHEFFILSRLATAAFAGLFVLPFLAFNQPLQSWTPIAAIWVLSPLAAAAWLMRNGNLARAQLLWQAGLLTLAALIVCKAGYAHGAALICLLLIPLEAAVSGVAPVQLLASGAGATFLLFMFGAQYGGLLSGADGFAGVATEALSTPAALYLAILMVGAQKIQTLKRQAEESHALHHRVLAEVIGDLVLRYDGAGAVLSASGGARAQFGLDPAELLGRGLFNRIHVSDRVVYLQALDECARCDGLRTLALRLRGGAAASLAGGLLEPVFSWAELRLHRLGASTSAAVDPDEAAIVGVVRNVTEAKEFEAALEAARAQAQSANAWKDRLLANVSHELRTPLNAIIGFSEILARPDIAPAAVARHSEYAGIIHTSAEHLLSVVNLILDMSKIEAGRFDLSPEPFELAPLIASCCDMLRLKAEAGGVALVREALDCPGELVADKRALRQVLINLLSNAVKFTRPNGRVTIGACMSGGLLHFSIADTGIGIAADQLPRLGDPFFQAQASYDRLFEGTGLGLSLVRGLVALLGGSLLVESAAGVGTRVTVRLPLDGRREPPLVEVAPQIETIACLPAPGSVAARCASLKVANTIGEKKIA